MLRSFISLFFPKNERRNADVVNLGYVLNVIEHEYERREALANAWKLTKKLLVVAAQVWVGEPGKGHLAYNDGFITTRNTFQKYYNQQELKKYIDDVLETDAVPAGLGIYFVFRDEKHAEAFRASRFRSRAAVTSIKFELKSFADYLPILQPLMDFVSERGRLPAKGELGDEDAVCKEFRTLARAFEVIKRSTNAEDWQRIIEKRKQDLLVYIALSRFQRRPQFTALPTDLQLDIKAFFRSYKDACEKGNELLFSLGKENTIATACRRSSIGKFVGNSLYVHTFALNELSPILRVYEGCASRTFGQYEQTTLIKFRADKPKVSYLYYPGFDIDAHPALHSSMQANLSDLFVNIRDYSLSENPPILHRKETFVTPDYPLYSKFVKLTAQEETIIGTKKEWHQRLEMYQVKIRGHRVLRVKNQVPTHT